MEPDNTFADGPALARVRLHVAYHGAFFHGFASNKESPTVEDSIVEAISTVTRIPVRISTAGRTDAGVHARQQVITVDVPASLRLDAFVRSINALSAPHIAVSDAQWVTIHSMRVAVRRGVVIATSSTTHRLLIHCSPIAPGMSIGRYRFP